MCYLRVRVGLRRVLQDEGVELVAEVQQPVVAARLAALEITHIFNNRITIFFFRVLADDGRLLINLIFNVMHERRRTLGS